MAKFLSEDGFRTVWSNLKQKFLRTDTSAVLNDNTYALQNLGLSATDLNGLLEKLGVHVGTTDPSDVDTTEWNEGDLYIWVNSN